jgi:Potential Queuosine, Q, salvage protein family
MADVLSDLRRACAQVADRATHVRIDLDAIPEYGSSLPLDAPAAPPDPDAHLLTGSREEQAAFWLTLDAINFGSGWFPTLEKPPGRSGYFTIASRVRERFTTHGPWSASELVTLTQPEVAWVLGQSADHDLMGLFAASLNDLGTHVAEDVDGRFDSVIESAGDSAVALVERLASWDSFADTSPYDELELPFLKRAQIAAADLTMMGLLPARDLGRLTMFADNLVPHVLRLDGILRLEPRLVERIEGDELIEHDSPEEVEIRACALHAVELIAGARPDSRASDIDRLLWHRGQTLDYKSTPRHRCRCTAY